MFELRISANFQVRRDLVTDLNVNKSVTADKYHADFIFNVLFYLSN